MRGLGGMVLAMGLAAAVQAAAQPVDGRAARDALFAPKGSSVAIVRGVLPEEQAQLLAGVAGGQAYYGAIAVSPDEGLMSEATVAAVNHHSIESAAAAAVRDCNARKKGRADCVVAALIRPRGYQEGRALQLSAMATEAFRSDYGRSGPRALAASPATGQFGIGKGADAAAAALAACAAGGATDCAVVVAD